MSDDDRRLLDSASQDARTVPGRTDLIREGDNPADVYLILEGFACRYKITSGGKRQIMAYLVPGDFCDLHVFVLKQMDHSIGTLSPCKVVKIPRESILEMLERPKLSVALWLAVLTDMAVLREWLVNLGQRPAEERVAHVLCELLLRLRAVGLASGDSYALPVTQVELADTMGLSHVHVNRVLRSLRKNGLIALHGKNLVIPDAARLNAFSGFNPNYLHLAERGSARQSALQRLPGSDGDSVNTDRSSAEK